MSFPYWPYFLSPPAISSIVSAAQSHHHLSSLILLVKLASFADSVSMSTKLLLSTSAGILKLYHGNVVRKIHAAYFSSSATKLDN